MKSNEKKDPGNNSGEEATTYKVAFNSIDMKKKIRLRTQPTKEQIISKALKFHAQGQIKEAAKYYQYFLDQGFADSRVLSNYGSIHQQIGQINQAITLYKKSIALFPNKPEAYSNLGNILNSLGKLEEAAAILIKAVELKPDFAEAHNNLGTSFTGLGQLQEAEKSTRKAIEIKPDLSEAHCNLGNILKNRGVLHEAEIATRKAIELQPSFAEAYSNLGNILNELNKLKEAEISTRKAIELKPNYADAHLILGNTLKELGHLEEAKKSILKSIELKSEWKSYFLYASCLFESNEFNNAKNSLEKANSIASNKNSKLLINTALKITDLAQKQTINHNIVPISKSKKILPNDNYTRLILNRKVDNNLIAYLYSLKTKELSNTQDARYGKGLCSQNFQLFDDNSSIIAKLSTDIREICKEAIGGKEIIICDSFFNIFISGSGATPHHHIKSHDKNFGLYLAKYSLVYYLDVGDQNGKHPGILKLYKPDEEILPSEGMIVIIDSEQVHAVSYHGRKDRVMIGVNFYGF